jgi:Fic family protein
MDIVTSTIKGKEYYYLDHTYRDETGKIIKKRTYLGKEIPSNIEDIKKEFMNELNKELWHKQLDNIKKNFNKEFSKLPTTAKKKYAEQFLIKFTYNTNRIEGSTITLKETTRLIQEGRAPNKPIKDIKEIESHKKVFEEMLKETNDLSLNLIKKWHKELFFGIDTEIAGRIREHTVAIAGSKFEPPQANEVDYLLRKFIQWYNNSKGKTHPVELATLIHLRFVTIHPFTDGNGRISRLLMNFILNKNNFPMLDIEYTGRNSYYNALERSQTKNEERIFLMHIVKRYLKQYKKYAKKD